MTQQEEKAMQDYKNFMYNPKNEGHCEGCPENGGFSSWPGHRLPCGQFRYWVAVHCDPERI